MDSELRTGSRLVPKIPELKNYFHLIQNAFIEQEKCGDMSASGWNRMMLFCLRLLQLTTGIRPIRDVLPDWRQISFATSTLRIADKDNLYFYEARVIPMTENLAAWLRYVAKVQGAYLMEMNYNRSNLSPVFREQATQLIFIYMEKEKGEARPFEYGDLLRVESDIGASFHFKGNALRHYLEARLIESHVDQHLIDFILGHKHFGCEPFGRYSPINVRQYLIHMADYIDSVIVGPLGIQLPPTNA